MVQDVLEHEAQTTAGRRQILHSHQRHSINIRPAVYVVRDGRDVVVSLYFHHVRHLKSGTPMLARRIARYFEDLLGPLWDPEDVAGNLPRFISSLSSRPFGGIRPFRRSDRFLPWPEHVRDWISRDGLSVVRYEDFIEDGVVQLSRIADYLDVDIARTHLEDIVESHSFERVTGRQPGVEDRGSFHRKAVAGDWKVHFTRYAVAAFQEFAGSLLIDLGYEEDDQWPPGGE